MNKSTDAAQPVELPSDPRQCFLPGKEFRLLDRYELQDDLIEALSNTKKHRKLAPRVAKCHRNFRHWRCENHHDWAEAEDSCSVRVCPHCSYRRTLTLAEKIEKHTIDRSGLRYVVLAERNSEDLAEGVKLLWESWTRLRRSVLWKKYCVGSIVALEVTYNPHCVCGYRKSEHQADGPAELCEFEQRSGADDPWHPHLNVLIEGEYFPFEALNRAWWECSEHRGLTSHIEAADQGTVRELIKYVTKITDLLDVPDALDQFLSVIDRRRLVRTYGTFYGLKIEDEKSGCCPDCGPEKHVSVVKLGALSPHQVALDFNGKTLRVRSRRPDLPPLIKAPDVPDPARVQAWSDRQISRIVQETVERCDRAAAEDWAERTRWKQQ